MRFTSFKTLLVCLGSIVCLAQASHAAYSFAQWNTRGEDYVEGTLNGIGLRYDGQVADPTQVGNTGNQYWTEYGHNLPYTPVTGVLPTRTDIVALSTVGAFTITFSQPVLNPVMLICSLGQPNVAVSYTFDQTATVLTSGYSWWNTGAGVGVMRQLGDRTVVGVEGSGVIAFSGLVSQISWTTDVAEYWHGFTLAAGEDWHTLNLPTVPPFHSVVPEPSTLIGGGLLALLGGAHVLRMLRRRV